MRKYTLLAGFNIILSLTACGDGENTGSSSSIKTTSSSEVPSVSSSTISVSSINSSLSSSSNSESNTSSSLASISSANSSSSSSSSIESSASSNVTSISSANSTSSSSSSATPGSSSESSASSNITSISSLSSSSSSSSSSVDTGQSGLWSNPNTWPSGVLPAAGENVLVPDGTTITLDISPPALGIITIEGSLIFENIPLNFTVHSISVRGLLQVGSVSEPITQPITITLTGTNPAVAGAMTRGIMVMDGILDLHAIAPEPAWTKLSTSTGANANQLSVVDTLMSWNAGDEIVVAPTDFIRIGRTEHAIIASTNNKQISLATSIQQPRWGALQYVDSSGITLSPTTTVTNKILDQRAEVGNLSRNIVIQSINDALWQNEGFGAHVMIMRPGQAFVEGVQFKRGGQAGILARYPIHWHRWSYANGQAIGDATGQYVKNSAIVSSSQRCVVIHGTNGVSVQNNICYDIHGHAMFLEDAVERRNVFDGNLVLHVNLPLAGKELLVNESFNYRTGPAGFWLTNPDNIVRNNVVADSVGNGFWLAYAPNTLGLSKSVPLIPEHMAFGALDDNTAHSNGMPALFIDRGPIDDAGNMTITRYDPFNAAGDSIGFTINRFASYKHESSGFDATTWNRIKEGTLTDFIISDHTGVGFAGSSFDCTITNSLVVGTTLNNANPSTSVIEPMGAASYHSLCEISNTLFVNLPAVQGKPSGTFGTADYYLRGLDKGLVQNSGSIFINSHAGYREPSNNTRPIGVAPQGQTRGRENFALSGALWDPYGYWGPAGNYWVYDNPFLTGGTVCVDVNNPIHGNDKSCEGPYYGVTGHIRLDNESIYSNAYTFRPLRVTRTDNNAEWFVDDGNCTPRLGNMRHFAAVKNGNYIIDFPAGENAILWNGQQCTADELAEAPPLPTAITLRITNVLTDADVVTLAVPFRSDVTPTGYVTSFPSINEPPSWASYQWWEDGLDNWKTGFRGDWWIPLTSVASRAELDASDGATYWQDTDNDLLWLRVKRMGMPIPANDELYGLLGYVINSE